MSGLRWVSPDNLLPEAASYVGLIGGPVPLHDLGFMNAGAKVLS